MSIFVNYALTAGLGGGAARTDKIIEQHVSGPGALMSSGKVAIVTVNDVIFGTEDEGTAGWIIQQLDHARDDSKVKAILLDVDSPGGGVTASDIIHRKILEVQDDGKAVVVLMRDIAASGGYYISAPADYIVAQPTTITGSIGVMMGGFNVDGLFQKIGLEFVVYKSGPYKDILSPYRPATEEEKQMIQGIVDSMMSRFKEIVGDGRGLSPEEVDALATGAVYTADDALDRKLIDAIGYYEDAVEQAKSLTRIRATDDIEVVKYNRPPTLADVLFGAKAPSRGVEERLLELIDARRPGFYYIWPGP